MSKFLKVLLVLILISAAVYFILIKKNTFGLNVPQIDWVKKPIQNLSDSLGLSKSVQQGVSKIQSLPGEAAYSLQNKVVDQGKSTLSNGLDNLKTGFVNSIAGVLGVNTNGAAGSSSAPVISANDSSQVFRFSIKVGNSIYFTINNPSQSASLSYNADWGDGQSDNGQIAGNGNKIISHSWASEGDYLVKFGTSGGNKNDYQVPISVFK